jgi:hypothetical protein
VSLARISLLSGIGSCHQHLDVWFVFWLPVSQITGVADNNQPIIRADRDVMGPSAFFLGCYDDGRWQDRSLLPAMSPQSRDLRLRLGHA